MPGRIIIRKGDKRSILECDDKLIEEGVGKLPCTRILTLRGNVVVCITDVQYEKVKN